MRDIVNIQFQKFQEKVKSKTICESDLMRVNRVVTLCERGVKHFITFLASYNKEDGSAPRTVAPNHANGVFNAYFIATKLISRTSEFYGFVKHLKSDYIKLEVK